MKLLYNWNLKERLYFLWRSLHWLKVSRIPSLGAYHVSQNSKWFLLLFLVLDVLLFWIWSYLWPCLVIVCLSCYVIIPVLCFTLFSLVKCSLLILLLIAKSCQLYCAVLNMISVRVIFRLMPAVSVNKYFLCTTRDFTLLFGFALIKQTLCLQTFANCILHIGMNLSLIGSQSRPKLYLLRKIKK